MSAQLINPLQQNDLASGRQFFSREVGLVLGMAKHQCRFHGICRIDDGTVYGKNSANCYGPRVSAKLVQTHPHYCKLLIPRNQLPAELENYHFLRPSLIIHKEIAVGRLLGRKMGDKLAVRVGHHPVTPSEEHYEIVLTLKNL